MSPVSSETIPNTALTGSEWLELIRQDFEKLLLNEGILSSHMAFKRCSHKITLELQGGFPHEPSRIESREQAVNVVDKKPQLAAVESFPLNPPPAELVKGGKVLTRTIESPNAERVRAGLGIPVDVRDPRTGQVVTQHIHYPREAVPEGPGQVALDEVERPSIPPPPPPAELSLACHCGHDRAHHALSGICAEHNDVEANCGCQEFRDARVPLPAPDTREPFVQHPEQS